MRYEGPIYRPPSEADSLLIQATVGCPHNRCTFCMIYKNGPKFKIRPVEEIKADIRSAHETYGDNVRTIFFPAGNTIAMKTDDLCEICCYAVKIFPKLERITVYGSSQYIQRKRAGEMRRLAEAGLSRIHVGLESGDDIVLRHIRKGSDSRLQVEAGRRVRSAGIQLSLYVILGIGGKKRTTEHALHTATAINQIEPDFVRLRTFVPKINTPLLDEVLAGTFQVLGPHEILRETELLIDDLYISTDLVSDHYSNYLNLAGKLPRDKKRLLSEIQAARERDVLSFRPYFIGKE